MRVPTLIAAWLAVASCCHAGAAPDAVWSKPANGLRCRLEPDQRGVSQGAVAIFHLHFRFEPEGVDPAINVLNRYFHPRRVTLTFTDERTGKTFTRLPDGQGWPVPTEAKPADFPLLRGHPIRPERLRVRLLAGDGQQLPAGTYSVVAVYKSDGLTGASVGGRDPADRLRGKWKLWSGRLATPAVQVTVRPAEPQEVLVPFHSALEVGRTVDGIAWVASLKNPRLLRLSRRPGYFLRLRSGTHAIVGGRDQVRGRGTQGVWSVPGTTWDLRRDDVERVLAGAELTARENVEICEIPAPPLFYRIPSALGAGDVKVLWKGSVEGKYSGKRLVEDPWVTKALACSLSAAWPACRRGEAVPAVLRIENVSRRRLLILSHVFDERLRAWRASERAELTQKLTAEPPGLRKTPIVLQPGGVHRVEGVIQGLFASLRLVEPERFEVTWWGGLLVGDGRDTYYHLYRAPSISMTVVPKAWKGGPQRPAEF